MKKYRFIKENNKNKVGDVVEMQEDFWTRYYQIKGIIEPLEQLEVQEIKPKKASKKSKKKQGV